SREHAPWALLDFGIRCIVSASFADIFAGNCVGNGILCVTLPPATVAQLMRDAETGACLRVDLERQEIHRPCGEIIQFEIPAAVRQRLLSGTDQISLTLHWSDEILAHEEQLELNQPWI
ncbi:MAG TPA: 3-isopropylmalate dehydratase small subunit, partial [Deltaproteobacteria bacterium]|nr:3-isopropylmalate dehydratase small subunit [Deltaproteobacteria bacterium]